MLCVATKPPTPDDEATDSIARIATAIRHYWTPQSTQRQLNHMRVAMANSIMDELLCESLSNNSDGSGAETTLLEELHQIYALDEDQQQQQEIPPNGNANTTGRRQIKLRKHRESMAKLRQDRRETIAQLGKLESALQSKLHKALQWMARHRASHEAAQCRGLAFVDHVQLAESLLTHKYALEEELYTRMRFSAMVTSDTQRLALEIAEPPPPWMDECGQMPLDRDEETSTSTTHAKTTGYWTRYQAHEKPFFYEYESSEACTRAIRDGLETVTATRQRLATPVLPSTVHHAHCLGWKAERSLDSTQQPDTAGPMLRFRFSKRVSRLRITLSELEDATWAMLQSPAQLAQTYCDAVVATPMQRVSDDAFILLRNSPVRRHHKKFRFFNLIARLRTADTATTTSESERGDPSVRLILMLILDKQPRETPPYDHHDREEVNDNDDDECVVWLKNGAASLQFSHVADSPLVIEIQYTGCIECVDDDHAAHLMMECCAALLRWEQLVVPLRLLGETINL